MVYLQNFDEIFLRDQQVLLEIKRIFSRPPYKSSGSVVQQSGVVQQRIAEMQGVNPPNQLISLSELKDLLCNHKVSIITRSSDVFCKVFQKLWPNAKVIAFSRSLDFESDCILINNPDELYKLFPKSN